MACKWQPWERQECMSHATQCQCLCHDGNPSASMCSRPALSLAVQCCRWDLSASCYVLAMKPRRLVLDGPRPAAKLCPPLVHIFHYKPEWIEAFALASLPCCICGSLPCHHLLEISSMGIAWIYLGIQHRRSYCSNAMRNELHETYPAWRFYSNAGYFTFLPLLL